MRNTNSGDKANDNFSELLNKFDGAKTKDQWLKLIEESKLKEPLTYQQRDAIIARCENKINGTYGNTKNNVSTSQYDQTRMSKPTK